MMNPANESEANNGIFRFVAGVAKEHKHQSASILASPMIAVVDEESRYTPIVFPTMDGMRTLLSLHAAGYMGTDCKVYVAVKASEVKADKEIQKAFRDMMDKLSIHVSVIDDKDWTL